MVCRTSHNGCHQMKKYKRSLHDVEEDKDNDDVIICKQKKIYANQM